jgi:hypothetical protein
MTYAQWLKYKGLGNSKANREQYNTRYLPAHTRKTGQPGQIATPGLTGATPDPVYGVSPGWTQTRSPEIDASIALLREQQAGLKAKYSGERLQGARSFHQKMLDAGMWDEANQPATAYTEQTGDLGQTYSFDGNRLGRGSAYRGAYRNATNQAAQRGMTSSSDRWDQWAASKAELNQRQQAALSSYDEAQRGMNNQQYDAYTNYNKDILGLQGQQATHLAGQQAPIVQLNADQTRNVGEAPPAAPAANAIKAQVNRRVFDAIPGDNTLNSLYGAGKWKKNRSGSGKWLVTWQ